MKESVYTVKLQSKELQEVLPVTFSEIGVKECQDLQQWVFAYPRILGEDLLMLKAEFSDFANSARRVDLLTLDKHGVLAIVELKLEMERTHAELQAIRYAAMCSTMTMDDAVGALARCGNMDKEAAIRKICDFLEAEDLPELSNQPRIILAASSFDDQELTSTVLWLRNFGIDIKCVEVLTYKMPSGELVLAPHTIIPLPETKSYQVKVERKQAQRAAKAKEQGELHASLIKLKDFYGEVYPEDVDFIAEIGTPGKRSLSAKPIAGLPIHYGWVINGSDAITVEIRFIGKREMQNFNKQCLELVRETIQSCGDDSPFEFKLHELEIETRVYCDVNPKDAFLDDSHLFEAARTMKFLREKVRCLHPRFEEAAKG